MVDTGYQPGSGPAAASFGASAGPEGQSLEQLKKDYLSYLGGKSEEIKEQQNSRRYYHGAQWTAKQIKAFNLRKQPVVTFNRIARKINAVVGLLERQRQDPRGFPRTPKHEQGAEVATAVLRYVLDEQQWKTKSPDVGLNAGIDGLSGIELMLEPGDRGDVEVGFETVDPGSFFYDPRSLKPDFSDAMFMGIGKWADVETVVEQFPDKAREINASTESGSELTSNPDSDQKWLDTSNDRKRLRLVDHWYRTGGEWHWCVYSGTVKLAEGVSPYRDEKKKTFCKYIMFSANVDHDGDRYGFVRNMLSSQDEINQRRSKGLHILNSRRLKIEDGTGLDVEKVRAEAVKPDGVIVYPNGTKGPEFDDVNKAAELQGHLGYLQEAKQEIENYGFNPALMGTGVQDMSGRAIALQQQAGIAELGPYLLGFKGWKLRVYRAIWNAVQQHWTAERWIRVTDDEQVAQFFAVNKLGVDPNTGLPAIINQLGALDVDVILDEGPDAINMQADAYDTLSIMAQKGQTVPPEVLIELSPVTGSVKKRVLDMIKQSRQQPPDPMQQVAMKLELEGKQAANLKTMSEVAVNRSKAMTPATGSAQPEDKSFERWAKLLDSATRITVAQISAGSTAVGDDLNRQLDAMLHFSGLQADAAAQLREQAHQRAMLALQPPPAAQPQAAA
jgi:hypothetical protein